MKIFITSATFFLYFLTYISFVNNPTELDLWCKDILKIKKEIVKEPLGNELIEVCSEKNHLDILNKIIYAK